MAINHEERAQILVEALPYIQHYYNKIIVVKYGGNAMVSPELQKAVMDDIVLLRLIGVKVVLVHGGGPEISDMLRRVGKESKFVKRNDFRIGVYNTLLEDLIQHRHENGTLYDVDIDAKIADLEKRFYGEKRED